MTFFVCTQARWKKNEFYCEDKLKYVPKVELIELILVHTYVIKTAKSKHNFSDEIDCNTIGDFETT